MKKLKEKCKISDPPDIEPEEENNMNIYYHTDKEFKNISKNLKVYLDEFKNQLNKQRSIKLNSNMVIGLWSLPNTLNCVDIKRL